MKLALYQPWIYLHGGLERSILELVTRSRHHWTIYTGYYDPLGTFPGFRALDVRTLNPTSVNRDMLSVLKSAAQVALQKIPLAPDTDALVVWCDGLGDLITFRNHDLSVLNICCTPLRAAFDPVYQQQALRERNRLGRLFYHGFRRAFRLVDRLAWKHYREVVAISGEVRDRILSGRLTDSGRITVAYPGVEWNQALSPTTTESFILVPGRIMWTKNIELAIRAFQAAELPPPWSLVIAGYVDEKSATYLARLRAIAGADTRIAFVLAPSDALMTDLLKRTSFCLFPPLNEDWGIVPLEAMACGKPVIANNSGGPRESIAHGTSGYLLAPDPVEWASTIAALAGNPELLRTMGAQAHAHVEQFSWDHFVAAVDDRLSQWAVPLSASATASAPGR